MAEVSSRRRRVASVSDSELSDHIVRDDASTVNDEDGDDGSGSEYTDNSDEEEVEGERNPADGESPHEDQLDDDEDDKNPAFIPRKGAFYEHDSRSGTDLPEEEARESGETEDKEKKEGKNKADSQKKLWEKKWSHDYFNEREQAPKTREELISLYGYDIRSRDGPPEEAPRFNSRGRGRRGRGRSSFGEYVNSSRSYRGQRGGGRGRYRGSRGNSYNNRNNYQEERPQEVRSEDARPKDAGSQDVRSQDVRSQDVRFSTERRENRNDPTPGEAFRSNNQIATSKQRELSHDHRPANHSSPRHVPDSEATPKQTIKSASASNKSVTSEQKPSATSPAQTAPPAGREESGKPKRYSSQRQKVAAANPPTAYMQSQPPPPHAVTQPVNQQVHMRYTGAAPSAQPVVNTQAYIQPVTSAQLMTPQSFMAGAPPSVMTGAIPMQPMQTPPMAAAHRPVISQGAPTHMPGVPHIMGPGSHDMVQSAGAPAMSYVPPPMANPAMANPAMTNPAMAPQGMPPQVIPPQGMPNQVIPAQGIPAPGLPAQGIPNQAIATQQFVPGPAMSTHMPATAPVASEPGVQIRGAVYYQSPAQQREGPTYYPTPPPSVPVEPPSGTTFYPAQQAPSTPPSGTFFPPAPAAEKPGPVYYNTQLQSGNTTSQSKPRAKNIIPIVKPDEEVKLMDRLGEVDTEPADVNTEASEITPSENVSCVVTSEPLREHECKDEQFTEISVTVEQPIAAAVTSTTERLTETLKLSTEQAPSESATTDRPITDIHSTQQPITELDKEHQQITDVDTKNEPIVDAEKEDQSISVSGMSEEGVLDSAADASSSQLAASSLLSKIRDEAAHGDSDCQSIQSEEPTDEAGELISDLSVPYEDRDPVAGEREQQEDGSRPPAEVAADSGSTMKAGVDIQTTGGGGDAVELPEKETSEGSQTHKSVESTEAAEGAVEDVPSAAGDAPSAMNTSTEV